jgi:hypothetical protein
VICDSFLPSTDPRFPHDLVTNSIPNIFVINARKYLGIV